MMAPGHWQLIQHAASSGGAIEGVAIEGETIAVPLDQVPSAVVDAAIQAANLIGDGLYGVDLKTVEDRCYVIEVNDNPNIDAGNEDAVEGHAVYERIMAAFRTRIERRRGGRREER